MKLLFVCSENRLRSPTAEALFNQYPGIEAIGAGTNKDAATPVSGDLIEWADLIFVMEQTHKKKVTAKFRALLQDKRVICLAIADNYDCMAPELIELLKQRVARYVELGAPA